MDLDLYEPLEGPDSIRLFIIEPGAFDDPIGGILVHATIKFEFPYLALSYVWGDQTSKVPISVNMQEFLVTKNLEMAIRRVRHPEKLSLYWIDAICINQDDLEERNQQVRIMRDIYSSASQVVVYVGEAGEGAAEAIKLIRLLEEEIDSTLPPPDSPDWDHFQDFFRRPWFTRVWVLQEVAVATEDPIVVCGEHQLLWCTIDKVAQFYHRKGFVWSRAVKDRSYHVQVMSWCRDRTNKYSILDLLTMTERFQATNPRDKLFALYGLALEVEHPEAKEIFHIDYSKPAREIYRYFTLNYLKAYGAHKVLAAVDISRESTVEDLPSWVPNWGASLDETHRPHPFMIDCANKSYQASAGFDGVVISLKTEENVLRIGVSVHDEIAWVSDAFEDEDFDILAPFRRPGLLMRIWNEVHSRLKPSLDLKSITDAFWRTLIANSDRTRRTLDDDFYIHFLRYWIQTRIVDRDAEEHIATHPSRPAYGDYEIRKNVKKDFDDRRCQSEEWYAALQRVLDKSLFDQGIVCTNLTQSKESDCKHCQIRDD
ncbi:HET-domain-containing protein, partial [Stipitochalara longipes BDJ]